MSKLNAEPKLRRTLTRIEQCLASSHVHSQKKKKKKKKGGEGGENRYDKTHNLIIPSKNR
jgi:hypothetical protein